MLIFLKYLFSINMYTHLLFISFTLIPLFCDQLMVVQHFSLNFLFVWDFAFIYMCGACVRACTACRWCLWRPSQTGVKIVSHCTAAGNGAQVFRESSQVTSSAPAIFTFDVKLKALGFLMVGLHIFMCTEVLPL